MGCSDWESYANLEVNPLKQKVYIGLGSNMGSKDRNLIVACENIEKLQGVKVIGKSSLYSTSPWGKLDQDDFMNQVLVVETEKSPLSLLHALQDIEIKMGRRRIEHWGPRIIDLDILLYGEDIINSEELTVPHPYMMERLFVLVPLQEVEPELVFPNGTRIEEVLRNAITRNRKENIKKIPE